MVNPLRCPLRYLVFDYTAAYLKPIGKTCKANFKDYPDINNLAFCYVIRYKWISDNGSFPGYEKLNKKTAKTG